MYGWGGTDAAVGLGLRSRYLRVCTVPSGYVTRSDVNELTACCTIVVVQRTQSNREGAEPFSLKQPIARNYRVGVIAHRLYVVGLRRALILPR